MTEWIPFLQSLVWPLFIAILLIIFRRQLGAILVNIRARIERGDAFRAGPGGISLGESTRKYKRLDETKKPDDRSTEDTSEQYKDVVYLVHSATRSHLGPDGREWYDIRVILDADSDEMLDDVEHVVYHLHPTFPEPDRETNNRKRQFELTTKAWGQFNLLADVYFTGRDKPLTLYRYLNF